MQNVIVQRNLKSKPRRTQVRVVVFALFTFGNGIFATFAARAGANEPDIGVELRDSQSGDVLNDLKALKAEMLVAKSESRAMKQLDRLIEKHKGTRIEAELWMRKGELYMRQAKTARFFEFFRDGEVVQRGVQTEIDPNNKRVMEAAVSTYEMVQKRFPNISDLDLVLFNNAFVRQLLGQNKEAEKRYLTLISKFDHSNLVPDSHLALGEMRFDAKAFESALEEYNRVVQYPNSRVFPYGLYKSAWTLYNLRRSDEALEKLERLAALGATRPGSARGGLDLRREALSDMVLFFSEDRPAKSAREFLSRFASPEETLPLLLKLARIYERHSKHADQNTILHEIVDLAPNSKERVMAEKEIIQGFEVMRDREKAVARLKMLSSFCKEQQTSKTVDDKNCDSAVVDLSMRLSSKWHKMWLKDQRRAELREVARQAYGIFFDSVDGPTKNLVSQKERTKATFGYAELLFASADFRAASQVYSKVSGWLAAVSPHRKGRAPAGLPKSKATEGDWLTFDAKLMHDSSYGALVSLDKATNDKWNFEDEQAFRQISETYIAHNPQGPFVDQVRFKLGLIQYEKSRYSEAEPTFKALANSSDARVRAKSQDLYLDVLNHSKRFKEMADFAKATLKNESSEERVSALTQVMQEAGFASLQDSESDGNLDAAAAGYRKFAEEHSGSKLADKAWWNHIQLLLKKGSWIEAAEAARQMPTRFPKSEYALPAASKAAQIFEETGQLFRAAQACEDLATLDQKQASKWKSLAGDFYAVDQHYEKAKRLLAPLKSHSDANISKKASDRLNWIEAQRLIEAKSSEEKEAVLAEFARSADPNLRAQGTLGVAEAQFKIEKYSEAFRGASQVVGAGKGVNAKWVAKGRLLQARILEQEFKSQSTKTRADRIAMVLAIKTEKLDKAQRAYQDVVRYAHGPTSVDALHRMAGLYGHYANSVRSAQVQGQISAGDRKALQAELDKLAIPMEEKQVEALETAIGEARKAQIKDGTLGAMQAELDRLNMKPVTTDSVPTGLPLAQVPRFNVSDVHGGRHGN